MLFPILLSSILKRLQYDRALKGGISLISLPVDASSAPLLFLFPFFFLFHSDSLYRHLDQDTAVQKRNDDGDLESREVCFVESAGGNEYSTSLV